MVLDILKKALMNDGVSLVFAKQLNENYDVRGCYAIVYDRRKAFHVVEQNLKQLRKSAAGSGVYILLLKDDKIQMIPGIGEGLIMELPEDTLQETLQKLPSRDFTTQVQSQRLLRKLGTF